jgi:hypothetical protein
VNGLLFNMAYDFIRKFKQKVHSCFLMILFSTDTAKI